MDIGAALKKYRNDCGLTQGEAADKLGVTRQAISNWERGHSIPDLEMAKKIAKLYDVKLEKLLGEEEVSADNENKVDTKPTQEVYSDKRLLLYIIVVGILCISCMLPVFGIIICMFMYYLCYKHNINKSFIVIVFTIIALIFSIWNTWNFINVNFLKHGTATIEVAAVLHDFYL